MIKRRFYRQEHGERGDASSDSSCSSSDSDLEAQTSADSDAEPQHPPESEADSEVEADDNDNDDDDVLPPLRTQLPSSSSSGYESEDSSAKEIDAESAGLPTNDDDSETGRDVERLNLFPRKENGGLGETLTKDHVVADDIPSCILRSKSAFKCRLCPKIVCLNMESLKTHLQSKRHARSEKLLNDGRLKRILNSDGEEEVLSDEDGETHAERHARIVALAQTNPQQKKSSGRQRQTQRLKRKKQRNSADMPKSEQKENRAKRRRKNID